MADTEEDPDEGTEDRGDDEGEGEHGAGLPVLRSGAMRTFAVILMGLGGLQLLGQAYAATKGAASGGYVAVAIGMVIGGAILYSLQRKPEVK